MTTQKHDSWQKKIIYTKYQYLEIHHNLSILDGNQHWYFLTRITDDCSRNVLNQFAWILS